MDNSAPPEPPESLAPSPSLKTIKFEDAIEQVESVIDRIESGEIGLEESLLAYEHATKLIGRCRSILNTAQKRIAQLTTKPDGRLRVSKNPDESNHVPDEQS